MDGRFYGAALSVVGALFLISCAHHPDVRPGAGNIHHVVVTAVSAQDGARDALSQARSFCKVSKKSPQILEEKTKYVGDMDEGTYKRMRTAGHITKVLGGATVSTAGTEVSDETSDLETAGHALHAAAGEGYQVGLRFSCH